MWGGTDRRREVGLPWFVVGKVFLDGESLDVTFGGCGEGETWAGGAGGEGGAGGDRGDGGDGGAGGDGGDGGDGGEGVVQLGLLRYYFHIPFPELSAPL